MSKDFVYDLMDRLEEQNTEYLLITINKGKEQNIIDVNFNLRYEDSIVSSCLTMNRLSAKLQEILPEDISNWDLQGDDDFDEEFDNLEWEEGEDEE